MATSAATSARVASRNIAISALGRWFYFGMSLLIAAVVIDGFSQTVHHKLIHAVPVRPSLLWVHGALFSGLVDACGERDRALRLPILLRSR
jgi:hypothetical protein